MIEHLTTLPTGRWSSRTPDKSYRLIGYGTVEYEERWNGFLLWQDESGHKWYQETSYDHESREAAEELAKFDFDDKQ